MHLRDFLALKPFHDNSLCSVCVLPQPAFYSQSAVCILHTVCSYPWSVVCSPQSTFYTDRFCILSNGSGYPFERELSSLRTTQAIPAFEKNCHPFERLGLKKNVFLSNGSAVSIRKNRHPFERLDELSVKNNCQPRYCSKPLLLPQRCMTFADCRLHEAARL